MLNEVQKMTKEEFEDILLGRNEEEVDALSAIINLLTSPIAKRKGVIISKEDCVEWAEDLKEYRKKVIEAIS